jgi:hypothetical protein
MRVKLKGKIRRSPVQDKKPEDNVNTSPNTSPENQGMENKDWREQRREWRQDRRDRRDSDPLRGLFPGLILILLGILLFLATQGILAWDIWWQYFLIGLGAIFIIDGLAHFWSSAHRGSAFGRFIPGVILLFVGLVFVFGFSQWWPLVLIVVGIGILVGYFFRRR